MDISLQQAIEIHARSLKFRFGAKRGVQRAYQEALRCRANGDAEGFAIWLRVRDSIGKQHDKGVAAGPAPSIH